jgi:hypothetical protein
MHVLKTLTESQVHCIAHLAKDARAVRDALFHGVDDEITGEPHPAKGEHDRVGSGGFDVLPTRNPALAALRAAIGRLQPDARSELYALMRIGQGDLTPGDWPDGLSEAARLGDEGVGGILADDVDLQTHLDRGFYELASR